MAAEFPSLRSGRSYCPRRLVIFLSPVPVPVPVLVPVPVPVPVLFPVRFSVLRPTKRVSVPQAACIVAATLGIFSISFTTNGAMVSIDRRYSDSTLTVLWRDTRVDGQPMKKRYGCQIHDPVLDVAHLGAMKDEYASWRITESP